MGGQLDFEYGCCEHAECFAGRGSTAVMFGRYAWTGCE